MAPFIQNMDTLREHPNVFQIKNNRQKEEEKPQQQDQIVTGSDEQPSRIQSAQDNLSNAVERMKVSNLNDFFLDMPEEPELDQQAIQQNQKLTRTAALMQVLDSLAGVAGTAQHGQDAFTAPARFDNLGFSALNNLQNLEEQHRIDLNQFNRRSDQVDQYNKQLQQQVEARNAEIDYNLAKNEFDNALNAEQQKQINANDRMSQHYEIGLRYVSQGEFGSARAHFSEAGLTNEQIDNAVQRSRSSAQTAQAGTDEEQQGDEIEFTAKQKALYNRYNQHAQNVTDDQYETTAGRVDYNKPKRNTDAWHMKRIEDELGTDFYLMDDILGEDQRAAGQNQSRERMEDYIQSPEIQDKVSRSRSVQQQTVTHNILNAPTQQAQEDAARLWVENNTQILREQGVPEEKIPELNEEMFGEMVRDIMNIQSQPEEPTDTNLAEQQDEQPEQAVSMSGMGTRSEEAAQPESQNRREALPRHLRSAYDVGDGYLQAKRRHEMLRERNPDANLSAARREERRLFERLKQRLSRLPREEDRNRLIESLDLNPEDFEDAE